MELRQLRHLIAIVEQRSFSAAAKTVHLTASALTRSMNALEESVGEALLIRKNNGIDPSPAGILLYEYARWLTAGADNARAEISRLSSGQGGQISIGVGSHLAELMLPTILSAFAERHPHLSVNLKTGMIEDLVPMVLEGEIELIASMVPIDRMQHGLGYERLFTTRTYVFAATTHRLAQSDRAIGFRDLVGERWVALNSGNTDLFLNRFFATGGEGFPKQLFRFDSLSIMRDMIENHGCLGVMPIEYMRPDACRALSVPGMPMVRRCGLLYRIDVPQRPIVRDFADTLRSALQQFSVPEIGEVVPK